MSNSSDDTNAAVGLLPVGIKKGLSFTLTINLGRRKGGEEGCKKSVTILILIYQTINSAHPEQQISGKWGKRGHILCLNLSRAFYPSLAWLATHIHTRGNGKCQYLLAKTKNRTTLPRGHAQIRTDQAISKQNGEDQLSASSRVSRRPREIINGFIVPKDSL